MTFVTVIWLAETCISNKFYEDCIVVEHVFCICPPYFDEGLTLHQSEAKVIGSSLAGMRN